MVGRYRKMSTYSSNTGWLIKISNWSLHHMRIYFLSDPFARKDSEGRGEAGIG
jgi:hypothetical protein